MAADKTTDATQVNIRVDPVLLEAVDKARGKLTRPQFFLKAAAKVVGIKKYRPRSKGYQGPKKTPTNDD